MSAELRIWASVSTGELLKVFVFSSNIISISKFQAGFRRVAVDRRPSLEDKIPRKVEGQ